MAKTDRDLLIYIFWQLGVSANQQIEEKFGLTYSAVSQRVSVVKNKLNNDKDLAKKHRNIKSIIKTPMLLWWRSGRRRGFTKSVKRPTG
jgi:hypothetical protein